MARWTDNRLDLVALANAIEAELDTQCVDLCALRDAADEWANARRAARDAGYVEVLVSREAVEKLRAWARVMRVVDRGGPGNAALPGLGHLAICALARDPGIAAVLKEGR